jgi:hypothetical protein
MKYIYSLILIIFNIFLAFTQESKKVNFFDKKDKFEEKLLIGIAFNNSWTTFTDIENIEVFTKPSLGFHVKSDYWFMKNLAISAGIGIQQRGAGVLVNDTEDDGKDMTYRTRLRTTNLSFPIQVFYRPNFYIFDQTKINIGAGIVPSYIFHALDITHSVEDGFHTEINNEDDYKRLDIPFRLSAGLDFNAGGSCLLRLEFNYDISTTGIYKFNDTYSGKNKLIGVEINCLF